MDKYRRNNQISDDEINLFKPNEIQSIKKSAYAPSTSPEKAFKWLRLTSTLVLTCGLLVTLVLLLFTGETQTLNVVQLNAQEYYVEASLEGEYRFNVYYSSHIVYENQMEVYDDTFGYKKPYYYAPQDVQDSIEIDFDIFYMNKYTYFVEAVVNGESQYHEVNYFPGYGSIKMLEGLEIDNFREDMHSIYNWIEAYPPLVTEADYFSNYIYSPNPDVYDFEDTKGKRNYITYVENYYKNGDDDDSDYSTIGSSLPAFAINNLVVLDKSDNTIIENTNHVEMGFATSIESSVNRFIHQIKFYTLDDNQEIEGSGSYFLGVGSSSGMLFMGTCILDGYKYAYMYMYLDDAPIDMSDTSYVIISYELHSIYDGVEDTITLDTILYDEYLIIPPFQVIAENDPYILSLFVNIHLDYYDSSDELIHEMVFDLN